MKKYKLRNKSNIEIYNLRQDYLLYDKIQSICVYTHSAGGASPSAGGGASPSAAAAAGGASAAGASVGGATGASSDMAI